MRPATCLQAEGSVALPYRQPHEIRIFGCTIQRENIFHVNIVSTYFPMTKMHVAWNEIIETCFGC